MPRREPNPYNSRARAVESALRDYAASTRVHVSSISRADAREILKGRGLYSSEGSLSRDLAAIRKAQPDFGGPRTAWTRTNTEFIDIDGRALAATRWEFIPGRVWRQGGYTIAARLGGEIVSVHIAVGARDVGAARAMALNALYEKVDRLRRRRLRRSGGGMPWTSRCPLCGEGEPEVKTEAYGWICQTCADRLESEGPVVATPGDWGQTWDTDPADLDIRVIVEAERAPWARYM